MSLYLEQSKRVAKLLMRYPSAIPRLVGGVTSATAYVDSLVKEEYRRKPIEVKRTHGFEIYLNPEDSGVSPFIAIAGTYEPEVTRVFKTTLKRGGIVIDVGANIGYFTLLAAKAVGETGRVIALEPEPSNFALLAKSVKRNGFPIVSLFQNAVSDIDGPVSLNLEERGNAGAHSVVRDLGGDGLLVESSTLDTVAQKANIDHADLVKVDVEGAEPQVVAGMRSLLAEGKVLHMIMEWNPREWTTCPELLSSLFEAFRVYRINQMSFELLTKVRKEALPKSQTNLYLAKK